jgi:N-acetylmuramoyl-L-alanine amidase
MFYIRARELWTAHPEVHLEYESWSDAATDVRVHHTAGSKPRRNTPTEEMRTLRETEAFHMNTRGYRAIAYNYLVMPSGRIYEGRGWEKHGAHTLNNNEDIGICFVGDYSKYKLSIRQIAAYYNLRRLLKKKGAKITSTHPHSDTFPTDCPGNNIRRQLKL